MMPTSHKNYRDLLKLLELILKLVFLIIKILRELL
jgi:hypothetical protein